MEGATAPLCSPILCAYADIHIHTLHSHTQTYIHNITDTCVYTTLFVYLHIKKNKIITKSVLPDFLAILLRRWDDKTFLTWQVYNETSRHLITHTCLSDDANLQKLAPHTQKFGLVIRAYVPVEYAEKLGP